MTDDPESTPHISAARDHLAAFLTELREARLAREAALVALAQYAHVARGLDTALEELEVR